MTSNLSSLCCLNFSFVWYTFFKLRPKTCWQEAQKSTIFQLSRHINSYDSESIDISLVDIVTQITYMEQFFLGVKKRCIQWASECTTNKIQNFYQNKVSREERGAGEYIERLVIGTLLII